MTATVPPVLVDSAEIALAITAIISTLALVSRLRVSRWFWSTLIGKPLTAWFQAQTTAAVASITAELVDPKITALVGEQKTMRETVTIIEERTRQLSTNDGHTLADAVNRTESKVNQQAEHIEEMHAKYLDDTQVQDGHIARLDRVTEELADGQDRIERTLVHAVQERAATDEKVTAIGETLSQANIEFDTHMGQDAESFARIEARQREAASTATERSDRNEAEQADAKQVATERHDDQYGVGSTTVDEEEP